MSPLIPLADPPSLGVDEEMWFEEKSDSVMSCDVHAYPPVSVVWKKDDKLLDLSSSTYKTSSNGVTATLSILNVNREVHEGVYICEANSTMFGVAKKSFNVTVSGLCLLLNSSLQ